MFSKYRCLNCGRVWRSGGIIIVCPVCRSKPIKIKENVDIKKLERRVKRW
ncbi:hypothetical protein ES705_26247 [subsurface metagenome]